MTTFKLFFSHRTTDIDRVRDLLECLKPLLPNFPFIDVSKDVPYSDDWKIYASQTINNCDVLVCIVGSTTYESEPINWEIQEAYNFKKPIVIAKLSDEYETPKACKDLEISWILWDKNDIAEKIADLLIPRALFMKHDWGKGDPETSEINDQYQIMVKSWEDLIQRRQAVNTVYLTGNTALLAAIGVLVSSIGILGNIWTLASIIFLAMLGTILSINWRRTVISYGLLSKAKAKIVTVMESYLCAKLFDTEWGVLEANRYKSTTQTDSRTALLFIIFFTIIMMVALAFIIFK